MNEDLCTRNYFNSLAAEWHEYEHEEKQKIYELLSKLDLEQDHVILDMGCGTGVLFPFLTQLTMGQAKIFAIDFAQAMAQKAIKNKNQSPDIVCGNVQYLPFRPNMFHRIIAFHIFPHIHHKILALKECRRVLKPTGELGIIHLHGSEKTNSFHAQIGENVKHHTLPAAEQMCHLLQRENFNVKKSIDRSEEYFIRAVKLN